MITETIKLKSPEGEEFLSTVCYPESEPWSIRFQNDRVGSFETKADDMFEALVELRLWLEAKGFFLMCKGSCKNVYPSQMSRQMSGGTMAYVLNLGVPAAEKVGIFEEAKEGIDTVENQKIFFKEWVNSL